MKLLKGVSSLFFAVLFAMLTGLLFSIATGLPLMPIVGVLFSLTLIASFHQQDAGVLRDGVYKEIWLGELVKRFRFGRSWLQMIPRYDQAVQNKVIHLVDVGADPQVFLNLLIDAANPVPTATRTDNDIPISLDRWDTENTRVSLTELRAISYDKMATTLDLHMNALGDKAAIRAAWRLAPAGGAGNQEMIKTTSGNSDGRAVAKKRITPDDIVMMSELAATPVEQGGPDMTDETKLIAVLDYRHVADLQKLDQNFDKQWKNAATGELFAYNGWNIYKFNRNATYTKTGADFSKKAFGAAHDAANDLHASLFFHADRAFAAADAAPEMFYRLAANDPELRSNTVGFRQWSIVGPKKLDGFFALVSDKV